MSDNKKYVLTEIWNAKPAWLALSQAQRAAFFEQEVGPLLGRFIEAGAEILGCVMNDNDGPERLDYAYMAVWKLPNKELSDQLLAAATEIGFLEYFDQANFSGNVITPDVMNADIINL